MSEKDGGQAFPQPVTVSPSDDMYPAYPGMTLRDYFAAHAFHLVELKGEPPSRVADWAYSVADAMLAAREVKS